MLYLYADGFVDGRIRCGESVGLFEVSFEYFLGILTIAAAWLCKPACLPVLCLQLGFASICF